MPADRSGAVFQGSPALSSIASLRSAWARVVVRVAGSWVTTIGLFMLGWALLGR
jgi:hypothetical protein